MSWPQMQHVIGFATGPNSTWPPTQLVDVTALTLGTVQIQRGRQYELDQVQAGQCTLSLDNTDGAFDPGNSDSPYFPNITPFRLYRLRARTTSSINLIDPDIVTPTGTGAISDPRQSTLGTATITTIDDPAETGKDCYQVVTADTGSGLGLSGVPVIPSQKYTAQFRATVSDDSTATTGKLTPSIWWNHADGTTTIDAGTAATITTTASVLSVTATAPTDAIGMSAVLITSTAPSDTLTVVIDNPQVETGGTASTFDRPSSWIYLFTGWIDTWPETWLRNGTRGQSDITCVDMFAILAQHKLRSALYNALLILDPDFLYALDEAGPSSFYNDLTGKRGPGVAAAGNQQGAQIAGTWAYGIPGPVVEMSATGSGSPNIDLPADLSGNIGPSVDGWSRMIAYRLPSSTGTTWYQIAWIYGGGDDLAVTVQAQPYGTTGWTLQVIFDDPSTSTRTYYEWTTGAFDQPWWDLIFFGTDSSGTPWANINGEALTAKTDGTYAAPGSIKDRIGGGINPPPPGQIACYAQIPVNTLYSIDDLRFWLQYAYEESPYLAASVVRDPSTGWKERSSDRYASILDWAAYAGDSSIDYATSGVTANYGPATETTATSGEQGTDVLSALQTVVDTENGFHFVAGDGTITFQSRGHRYNPTKDYTFGEDTDEIAYEQAQFSLDTAHVANDMQLTQTFTQRLFRAIDSDAISDYGDIQYQRNINTMSDLEMADAGNYLLDREAYPVKRLVSIQASPLQVDEGAAVKAIGWNLLALELGKVAQVYRRPPNATAISWLGFVEHIQWTLTDQGVATLELEMSPAANMGAIKLGSGDYGRLAADDGNTLNAAITATDTSLEIASTAAVFTTASGDYPLTIQIDAEQITLKAAPDGSASPQSFTSITRGANGTTAAAHDAAAPITVSGAKALAY